MHAVDVRRFGAVGDGITVETTALQAAIDDCAAAGGGVVELQGGTFVTGTLELRTGVRLHIAADTTLAGSTSIGDYRTDTSYNRYKDEPHMDRCLIYAAGADSIGIEGGGTIDGRGGADAFPNADDPAGNRPMLIRFVSCTGVDLRGVRLEDPAAWTAAFLFCADVRIEDVTVSSRVNHNGDGFDFDGCRDVLVRSCVLDTSDDSICLQTSMPDEPCERVRVERCRISSRWAGIRVGLLSRGAIRDVVVEDCVFEGIGDSAVKIQMCEGGELARLTFRRLVMRRVVRVLFVVLCRQRAARDAPDVTPPLGTIREVLVEAVDAETEGEPGSAALLVLGDPKRRIESLILRDVAVTAPGGGREPAAAPPEFTAEVLQGWWPEVALLGTGLPATALYARHVDSLVAEDLRVDLLASDQRPPVVLEDVTAPSVDPLRP